MWSSRRGALNCAAMFDIGGGEFLFLILLGLLVFGPKKLPEIGKQVGGMVAQLRRAMREFQTTLDREVEMDKLKDVARDVQSIGRDARGAVQRQFDAALAEHSPPEVPGSAPATPVEVEAPVSEPSSSPKTPAGPATGSEV